MSFKDWQILRGLRENFFAKVEEAYVFSDGKSAILSTKDNKVYGIGDNAGNCLGLGEPDRYGLPTEIPMLLNKKVKQLISGGDSSSGVFVVACLHSGELYFWGRIDGGSLDDIGDIGSRLKNVKTMACGKSHCLILSGQGKVFKYGANNRGQLGLGSNVSESRPNVSRSQPKRFASTPRYQLGIVEGYIKDKTVIDISCGYEFSVALLDSGKVVTWGDNTLGQLGMNCSGTFSSSPAEVPSLSVYYDVLIEQIACGRNHVLALTKTGTLYVWGSNDCGELGIGRNATFVCGCPMEVKVDGSRFTDIHASYLCCLSVAQCENGEVYMWGATSEGNIWTPTVTKCESFDQVFATHAKPKVMLRPLFKKIRVIIRDLNGKFFHIYIEPTDTIEVIKERLQEVNGMPTDQQRLIFVGKQMEDSRIASDYGLKQNCRIELVLRLRGE